MLFFANYFIIENLFNYDTLYIKRKKYRYV